MGTSRKVSKTEESAVQGKGGGLPGQEPTPTPTLQEFEGLDLGTRVRLIQELIPVGVMMASLEMEREVKELAGERHVRSSEGWIYRYGSNPGSIVLGEQRVSISVPRLRDAHGEVPLRSYQLLHSREQGTSKAFQRVLGGISCRSYGDVEKSVVNSNGKGRSKSTVSSQFVKRSRECLQDFQGRDLSKLDVVAVFIDGKYFAKDAMVIALGIQACGEKSVLGFVQTATENEVVVKAFLRSLLDRGLSLAEGVLCVIDGSKGLRSGIQGTFGGKAVVQRCQWHKRENVVSYLPKDQQTWMRKRLQRAYDRPTHQEAKAALVTILKELSGVNQSAATSLEDGFDETLTLHRLGVFGKLGRSFKTTNCIENLNSMIGARCDKVDRWQNSDQKQRWLAAALTEIEPKLRRVQGHHHLPALKEVLSKEVNAVKKHVANR